jgi:hypothetical protein
VTFKKIAGALFEKSAHSGIFYDLKIKFAIKKAIITQKPISFDTKWLKIDQKIILSTIHPPLWARNLIFDQKIFFSETIFFSIFLIEF